MTPAPEQNDDKPLDPAVERVRRKMMRLMLVSIGIMMIGLMAVVGAIVYKLGSSEAPPAAASEAPPGGFQSRLRLEEGSRIVAHSLSGEHLTLIAEDRAGRQSVILFDLASGEEAGRISILTD